MTLPEQFERNLKEIHEIARSLHRELREFIEMAPIFNGDMDRAVKIGALMGQLHMLLGVGPEALNDKG